MKRAAAVTAVLATLFCCTFLAFSAEWTRQSKYRIVSRGIRVGDLVSTISRPDAGNPKLLKFVSTCSINANFVVYSYALENREEALVGDGGAISYLRTEKENDSSRRIEGRLMDGKFHLQVVENGRGRNVVIDRNLYDYTTMECPEITMKKAGDRMELRLLDFETMSVVTRRYAWVRNEEIAVGGRKFQCRVIDFEDANKKCRRWIKPDEGGVIIVRQDGKGKSGSYSLRMVEHT